jgi:predicted nucleotide-binding protein
MEETEGPNKKDHELFDLISEDIRRNPGDYRGAGSWLDDYCSEESYWKRQEEEFERLQKDAADIPSQSERMKDLQESVERRRTPALMARFHEARDYLLDRNEAQTLISFDDAKRILIVTWLSTDPEAENTGTRLTALQDWHWEPTDAITSMSRGIANALWMQGGAGYKRWVELAQEAWNRVKRARGNPTIFADKTKGIVQSMGSDVFVVHGHDDGAKSEVARFIEKLGLKAVVLHEEANKGRTIIEKFEDHANVGFAVVLMTPDDRGCKNEPESDLKPRARQNVILELGFFLGRLGRQRVCALYKGDVEMPSDYSGVLYVPLDATGARKASLAKEIEAAGIKINPKGAI